MSLADLTLTDCSRLRKIAGLVRLSPAEQTAFKNAAMGMAAAAIGVGTPPDREDLLRPLERTRETLVRHFGEAYTADLIARLRR